jgi:2,3,4,5-tetrahydropyridine-2,6-dicarboxylate N-succinyltransferase
MTLRQDIERLYGLETASLNRSEAAAVVSQLRDALNRGTIRAAEPDGTSWRVNAWVKKGILLAFRAGVLTAMPGDSVFSFFDKDTMGTRNLTADDGIRLVPGGSVIRDGAYVAPGVVIMPPSYVNIGAYVGEGSMIDSHALVGSCAQVGKRVHLSAASQIGGVLEPIGSLPVIVEDDVFIGGNAGIYEGTHLGMRSVIGAGVILTRSTPVYDLVKSAIHRAGTDTPLRIPAGAVVIMGSRKLRQPFAEEHGLSLSTPVIVKYRDDKTEASTVLEQALR